MLAREATLYTAADAKHLRRALATISESRWEVESVPHARPNGERGTVLRLSGRNPARAILHRGLDLVIWGAGLPVPVARAG